MKKILKTSFFIIVIIAITILAYGYFKNEPLPNGKQGIEADSLANGKSESVEKLAPITGSSTGTSV